MKRFATSAVAAALVATALLPAAATAKPGYFKAPPGRIIQLLPIRGTHGYRIHIAVIDGRPQLAALRGSQEGVSTVFYRQTKKRDTGADLDADFGKAGKLRARFVPGKVKELKVPKGCSGGPTIIESGYFVGPLSFHGPRDFTSFEARRVRGIVSRSPGQVCPVPVASDRRVSGGQPEEDLQVIAGDRSGAKYFDAFNETADGDVPSATTYVASDRRKEGSVDILEAVVILGAAPLAIPDLTAALPATVTIEPPEPFSGSATLEAPSRATATLSGDLAVDLPATGEMPLSGPGIIPGLCRGYTCTGSLPKVLRPKRNLGVDVEEIHARHIR